MIDALDVVLHLRANLRLERLVSDVEVPLEKRIVGSERRASKPSSTSRTRASAKAA